RIVTFPSTQLEDPDWLRLAGLLLDSGSVSLIVAVAAEPAQSVQELATTSTLPLVWPLVTTMPAAKGEKRTVSRAEVQELSSRLVARHAGAPLDSPISADFWRPLPSVRTAVSCLGDAHQGVGCQWRAWYQGEREGSWYADTNRRPDIEATSQPNVPAEVVLARGRWRFEVLSLVLPHETYLPDGVSDVQVGDDGTVVLQPSLPLEKLVGSAFSVATDVETS